MNEDVERRRALAEKIRNQHQKGTRRRRTLGGIFVAVGVVACLGALLWLQVRPDPDAAAAPQHATDDYGFTLTPAIYNDEDGDADDEDVEEPIAVSLYEDFLCDSCQVFHEESGSKLAGLVEDGTIALTYYPFPFLVNDSTDEYSERAANAAVCVADEAGVLAYATMHDLLFEYQPARGGDGLSDDRLTELAAEAGAEDAETCIAERTYDDWITEALESGMAADVNTTPTLRMAGLNVVKLVDGEEHMPGPSEIDVALKEVQE